MLKQRVITSLILAPLMTWGILVLPDGWFALLFALVSLAGFWEWSAFVTSKTAGRLAYLLSGAGVLVALYFYVSPTLFSALPWLGIVWLLLASFLVIRYPEISALWRENVLLKALIGMAMLLPMWVSLIMLQRTVGAEFVLVLAFLIWGADVGAYFAGRAWGKRKLAPSVSPGKSWEGVIGGLCVAGAVALVASYLVELPMSTVQFGGVALLVAVVSVMGDLIESLFKRITGIKDSGNLLPGHGGMLDRIDSLTTAAPVFYLALTLIS